MSLLASLAGIFCMPVAAAAPLARGVEAPHPAVVRIMAPDTGGVAYGSGALVATSGQHGLVVTNWHVVRDAVGQIVVAFPDGFRSVATVLATDADWDLAALAVWRPSVEPIPLAVETPRPGDRLTIAGYGSGQYRSIAGRCTQYVAPGPRQPFEMVELSAPARQGDSGGPILNDRGELAGVLFGSAGGSTTGSYCGRVRWFLARVSDQFQQPADASAMLAAAMLPKPPAPSTNRPVAEPPLRWPQESSGDAVWQPPSPAVAAEPPARAPLTAAIPAEPAFQAGVAEEGTSRNASYDGWKASDAEDVPAALAAEPETVDPLESYAPTRLDQIKTLLAAVGVLAILLHGLRLLSFVQGG